MTIALLSTQLRPLLEPHLPEGLVPRWCASPEDILASAPEAEIVWLEMVRQPVVDEALRLGERVKWVNTMAAGVERMPLALLRERGVMLTNGAGLHALTIGEYALMGMLVIAKGYRAVVAAQERHEWLRDAPGKAEIYGSKVLILGAGGIGGRVAELLAPFGAEVTTVRRRPSLDGAASGVLGPDEWRGRLSEFDWVVVAVASTEDTRGMIGAAEFAAMKPGAAILNFSRGFVIDTAAMIAALEEERLGAAFLDVTDPEPLPADHRLWDFPNVHVTMHLSGRSQTLQQRRGADRFLANLAHYRDGAPLDYRVDLSRGY